MKTLLLAVTLALAGCGSNPFKGQLTNRITMTLAEDEVHINSMYGWLGIASKADERDVEVIRELRRLRGMVEAIQRAQSQAQRDKAGS